MFAVRPGNPKKIKTWDDLVKPGVQSRSPPTRSPSGAAKWNILAAYGAQRKLGKTDKQGQAYVQKLFRNVVVQAKSGRDATNAFLSGKGDVLLAYENEALASRKAGQDIQFTIPKQTMLIEAPIAVLKTSGNRDKANQFIRFTKSDTAQRIWAEWGFRPVSKKIYRGVQVEVPVAPDGLPHQRSDLRRLDGGRQEVVRPEWKHHGRHREGHRGPNWLAHPPQRSPAARFRAQRERASTALSLGIITLYLTLIVMLPIAALVWASRSEGKQVFWDAVTSPQSVAALKLTVGAAFIVAVLNAVLGTVTAWVLVRDDFRGKSVINSIIDLPFALPTIVAGLTLLALYGPSRRSGSTSRSLGRRSSQR